MGRPLASLLRPILMTHAPAPADPRPEDAAPPSHAPALVVRSLGGQRGDRPLFEGLDLTLAPGEIVWLRGRNGRGKTTLLRLLAGLSTPAYGTIALGGHAVQALPPEWRSRLVYLAHVNALKDDLSSLEALRFLASLHGAAPSLADLDGALAALGIASRRDAWVRTLSQGQRRRVALARLALPHPPSVWLLDEPFDALDDLGVQALHRLLAAHSARKGSVLMTSHQAPGLRDAEMRELDLDRYAIDA
jgi:heme exporter protein A